MILNKFTPFSWFHTLKVFSFQLLAFGLFSCNKTANVNGNKAFLGVTHVAYGVGPLNLTVEGDTLLPFAVSLGQTSGIPGNPYDTVISRVNYLSIFLEQNPAQPFLQGNAAFQQQAHYSMFIFDTLDIGTANLIIFQDNASFPAGQEPIADTFAYIRYLNFSPGSKLGLYLVNARDTVSYIPAGYFVGYNLNPSAYPFLSIPMGYYSATAYIDSLNSGHTWHLDSLLISNDKIYNVYLQGFINLISGPDTLQLKSVLLN
jgi:hypothetical protein